MKNKGFTRRIGGFTLIELLVVVAVLGILASVVLVAINPTKRMQEAKDAGKKNDVGQVALAVESCYTKNEGSYTNCDTMAKLTAGNYLKRALASVSIKTGTELFVCADLEANGWWVYSTATGASAESATNSCL